MYQRKSFEPKSLATSHLKSNHSWDLNSSIHPALNLHLTGCFENEWLGDEAYIQIWGLIIILLRMKVMEREVALVKTDHSVFLRMLMRPPDWWWMLRLDPRMSSRLYLPSMSHKMLHDLCLPATRGAFRRSITAFDYWLTVCAEHRGTRRSCPSRLPPH